MACHTGRLRISSSRGRPKTSRTRSIASSYVTPHKKRLLVVEDNEIERRSIVDLLLHDDIEVAAVAPVPKRSTCSRRPVECCVLDLRLPDMSGFELLEQMQGTPSLRDMPVVVFTGKELSERGGARLQDSREERRAQGRAVARAAV